MGLMTALLMVIGDYIGGSSGMTFMLAFSILSNVLIYWFSDKIVISQYNAQPVDAQSAPRLYGIVEGLAQRAGLPMPRVYVIDTALPNAFATGRNPSHAAVCVTTGLMEMLEPRETAGVLGHEMSHVLHNNILISTIAVRLLVRGQPGRSAQQQPIGRPSDADPDPHCRCHHPAGHFPDTGIHG